VEVCELDVAPDVSVPGGLKWKKAAAAMYQCSLF
jgi:hypothetical protein